VDAPIGGAARDAIVKAFLVGVLVAASCLGTGNTGAQERLALALLLERFEQEPVFFRQLEIARQIVGLRDVAALPPMEAWLDHEDRHVRANAAYIFAGLDDARGFKVIDDILSDRSDRPLGQGIPGVAGNIQADRWWLRAQIEADRYYAVHVLGVLRDPRALDVLLPLLRDDEISHKVAWALGEVGDPRAIPALIGSLNNPDALVRSIAIQSLAELRAVQARPYIEALLSDTALPSAGDRIPVGDTARAALKTLSLESR
jgi:HEAT repeat protein